MTKIPVFFSRHQIVNRDLGASPSARKPVEVIASWAGQEFPIQVHEPTPVTLDELFLAHDPFFVQGIFELEERLAQQDSSLDKLASSDK